MRAMVVRETGGPQALKLELLPMPEPGRGEVLIKVAACGVCMHDVVTRNGVMKRGVELPLIPGHEISGTVAAVGEAVRTWKAGDRVASVQRRHVCGQCRYCRSGRETSCPDREFLGDVGLNGGYAEYVLIDEDQLARVPDGVNLESAAVVACAIGTELNAIRDVGQLKLGEICLITGAGGGLGMHGIQVAKAAGAHTVAVTSSPKKAELCKQAGADLVILTERGEDFSKKVKAATDGYGCDVVIDNVGSPVFNSVRRSLAVGGRWVLVGQLSGEFVPLNPAQLFLHGINMLSAVSTTRVQLEDSLALVTRGLVKPFITGMYDLAEAPKVHALVEAGESAGRILLKP